MSSNTIAKAKQYLIDGKVRVFSVRPQEATFLVQGSADAPYRVYYYAGSWTCACPAQVECAHIQACKLIYVSKSGAPPTLFKTEDDLNKFFTQFD